MTRGTLFWLIAVVVLVLGFALYRFSFSEKMLNVDPRAAEEIEKAKRR